MVAEQIKAKLEEILNPDTLLDSRERPSFIFDEFADEDNAFYEELSKGDVNQSRAEDIAKIVAQRFGVISKDPHIRGSNRSLFVSVRPEGSQLELRLKGFNAPNQIYKNKQHIDFLRAKGGAGYNAAIGYGGGEEHPLYLVMFSGADRPVIDRSADSKRTDPLPTDLNDILDFIKSYSLNKDHIGPTENIKLHLDLVESGIARRISISEALNDNQKYYWIEKISKVISTIKGLVRKESSMWVLSDALLENFVKLENNDGKKQWTITDQGYSEGQLNDWKQKYDLSPEEALNASFYGRFEYNLGQLFFSLRLRENIDRHITELFSQRMLTLVESGIFNKGRETDIGKPRSGKQIPGDHNPSLSHSYFYLGILEQVMCDMARTGEVPASNSLAQGLLYTIDKAPYDISDKLTDGIRRGKSYL